MPGIIDFIKKIEYQSTKMINCILLSKVNAYTTLIVCHLALPMVPCVLKISKSFVNLPRKVINL